MKGLGGKEVKEGTSGDQKRISLKKKGNIKVGEDKNENQSRNVALFGEVGAASLPAEVWQMILEYVDEVGLLNFIQVQREWSGNQKLNLERLWRGRTLSITNETFPALISTAAEVYPRRRTPAEVYPRRLVLSHAPSKEALALISPRFLKSVEVNCGKLELSVARGLVKLLKNAKLERLKVKSGGSLRKLLSGLLTQVQEFSLTQTYFQRKEAIEQYNRLFEAAYQAGEGSFLKSLSLDLPLSFVEVGLLTAVLGRLQHVDLTNPEFTMEQALAVFEKWSKMEPALKSLNLRGRLLTPHGGPADLKSQMPIAHLGQAEAPLVQAASRVASVTFHKCFSLGQFLPRLLEAVATSCSVKQLVINNVKCTEEEMNSSLKMLGEGLARGKSSLQELRLLNTAESLRDEIAFLLLSGLKVFQANMRRPIAEEVLGMMKEGKNVQSFEALEEVEIGLYGEEVFSSSAMSGGLNPLDDELVEAAGVGANLRRLRVFIGGAGGHVYHEKVWQRSREVLQIFNYNIWIWHF